MDNRGLELWLVFVAHYRLGLKQPVATRVWRLLLPARFCRFLQSIRSAQYLILPFPSQ